MAIASFEDLCAGFCELVDVQAPQLSVGDNGLIAFHVALRGVTVNVVQRPDDSRDHVFVLFELGYVGGDDHAHAQMQALLEANHVLLQVNPPMFSLNPATGQTPTAERRPSLTQPKTIVTANADLRRPANQIPNTSRPALGLALADVIANTALRNQVHRDRLSENLDPSQARHKYMNRMANGDTIESWYEVGDGLIWIRVGSDEDAPCVRIRLAADRKTVIRIDEPIARLPVASREPLAVLVDAGVIQPQACTACTPVPRMPRSCNRKTRRSGSGQPWDWPSIAPLHQKRKRRKRESISGPIPYCGGWRSLTRRAKTARK